ncbi:sensor histidine kinase, partial [Candidatus Woesearchaeota archaeon]|nr:sensor histidine kinase [Candidatus Woesearchaeota archaeon]
DLTNYLFQAYGVDPARVKLKIDIPALSLNIDTAIPLGLIINELVSNCLKYAFRGRTEGEVFVYVYPDADGMHTLIVRDNGTGFPGDMDFRKPESLGLRLITLLAQQLDGTIELSSNNGTEFIIKFREQQYKKAGNPDNEAK